MALISCNECGAQISDRAASCPKCGAPVIKNIPCPDCGCLVPENAATCANCGAPLSIQQPMPTRTQPLANKMFGLQTPEPNMFMNGMPADTPTGSITFVINQTLIQYRMRYPRCIPSLSITVNNKLYTLPIDDQPLTVPISKPETITITGLFWPCGPYQYIIPDGESDYQIEIGTKNRLTWFRFSRDGAFYYEDSPTLLMLLFTFFFPIIGLIVGLVNLSKKPMTGKTYISCALLYALIHFFTNIMALLLL